MHMYSFAKQYIYLSTVIIYITVVFILNVLKATILRRLQYMDSQTDNFSKNPCYVPYAQKIESYIHLGWHE